MLFYKNKNQINKNTQGRKQKPKKKQQNKIVSDFPFLLQNFAQAHHQVLVIIQITDVQFKYYNHRPFYLSLELEAINQNQKFDISTIMTLKSTNYITCLSHA